MSHNSVLLILLVPLLTLKCMSAAEDESHGAFSPHEKRLKEHYHSDGTHNAEFDHESVLGSRKEAKEFDQLSPDESKRRLRALCKKMDTNADGFVDKDELTVWVEHSLKQLDQEEVDERFDEVDENHDGKITWDEYKRDAFGDGDDLTDTEDVRLLEEDTRYFKAADQNNDSVLDRAEFAAFQNPEAFDHMYDALWENTLSEKDKNKDGFIELDEFIGDNAGKDNEWYAVEKDRFTTDYDTNHDGRLSKEEAKPWLMPSLNETAREETRHLFEGADKEKDDRLSYDEIVAAHELFVGSEATNYGEHLEKLSHDEL